MMKISEMPKYEVYKDSGVEWLGDIPASWSLLANKHIFRLKKKQVGKRSSEYDLLSLTLRGVIKRDMENPEGKFPAEFDTYQEVQCGDFIFCLFDVEETPRTVGLSPFNGMITGAYTVFELNDNFDNRFLYYFYMNLDAKKMLKPLYRGLRNTIPKDSFLSFKTFVPPHEQQTRIANFLDKKTALIDEAISIKEQQISLLKERKQIIIQQAVTQGLDPNVPMKDSGVDWIGKIPAHWDIVPGFTVFKEGKDSNKGMIESQVLSLSYGNVIIKPEEKLVGLVPESFETYQIALPGDIIIRCTDLQNDKTSLRTGIVRNKGIITSAYLNLRLKTEHSAEFMHYFLHVLDITKTIYRFGSGLRQNLSYKDFKHMRILMPPKAEQIEIVNYINNQVEVTESSIDLIKNKIEKLKEYKTTLINSAVTGKIKITPEMVEQ
ncbi:MULTISPECIES: restriction endonuclease subunit S [Enterobacteriaceae]|uniref:Restriction endonuclease subunit S n=1 Tax=Escherichia coli TaxID=562 RepID=A0A2L1KTS8_ECOLX|nr:MULTISPECIES: restriction endonuclease subunit S [Enterobacteriaceae]AVE25957.1 restriction endonuclease subunit S [Escherichia coli]ESB47169.1 type I restriction modification DNA specificity domain-containing protein [Salmonella enterica subsp. enterica serovar Agona str. 557928]MCC6083206.1 restriction endonuclease subunit S [Escherichia coli]MEB7258406.1 restriction endonuclease subunit S [Escherichia coli]UIR48644.1 restriction endonuclease subunit S [Escherichia coli]